MSEHPILFSGEMVRAILDGRKTVTRRVVKPQPAAEFLARGVVDIVPQWPDQDGVRWFMADGLSELVRCPYGQPSDLLWVRETWNVWEQETRPLKELSAWVAGGEPVEGSYSLVPVYKADDPTECEVWRRSIHMPRWASRLTLEVAGVSVERVQDISEEDCKAEGLLTRCGDVHPGLTEYSSRDDFWSTKPRTAFLRLWDSINAKRGFGWEANPWVWVVRFKRVEGKES